MNQDIINQLANLPLVNLDSLFILLQSSVNYKYYPSIEMYKIN